VYHKIQPEAEPTPTFSLCSKHRTHSTQLSALSRAKPLRAQRRRKNSRNPKAGYRLHLFAPSIGPTDHVLILCCVEEVTGSSLIIYLFGALKPIIPCFLLSERYKPQCSPHHQPPPSRARRSKPNVQSYKPGVPAAARADRVSAAAPTYNSRKPQIRRRPRQPRKRKRQAASPAAMEA
jgi:hypothetical protein